MQWAHASTAFYCLFSYSYVLRNFAVAGCTAEQRCQGIGCASLCVLDGDALLRRQVIKAAMPPFSNENLLHSKAFSLSQSNYNKNKRSSQCDCLRKSKHSKCRYTCEKRRGLTGIFLQYRSKSGEYPHRKTERSGWPLKRPVFIFGIVPSP